jgi:AcrR family transcriptional regulator
MTQVQGQDDTQSAPRPGAGRTARERAREQITREIKEEARRQLAAEGAQRLSLRAVARELGMVSSALYRYFPSRDDLLTALIIDAYDAVAASAERADARLPRAAFRARWLACCHAIRAWAIASPHEYALIYGSPVPGYQAPQQTIAPAARVAILFGRVLSDAWAAGAGPAGSSRPEHPGQNIVDQNTHQLLPGLLAGQAAALGAEIGPGVPAPVIARALVAWTQLFGMISFELFGQLVGSADPSDDFFGFAAAQLADFVGLPQ